MTGNIPRRGIDQAIDPVRQRNASQSEAGQLSKRSTVRVDRSGDLEVRTDATLEVLSDGRLRVVPKGATKLTSLRDLTQSLSITSDLLEEAPGMLSTSTTAALIRADLNDNILPPLRTQISNIAAKVNQILEEMRRQ